MNNPSFCVLIPSHPHIRNAKQNKRLNISAYFGLKIVLNELELNHGIIPEFVTYEHVHKFDFVLVSMLSIDDFYRVAFTFYHRLKGKKNNIWIGGGAAVQNLAPLSDIFDAVLIGRAEGILDRFISALLHEIRYYHPSIVYFDEYREGDLHEINYVKKLYSQQLGSEKETMSGCKYNCGYCRYRISALPPKMRDSDKDTTMPGNEETFWELTINNSKPHTTSLDGLRQGIRYAVTKRIADQDIVSKLIEIGMTQPRINLKVYLICAYPNNPEFDFSALRDILAQVDRGLTGAKFTIKFHITPFSAEPGTPMQWEPVNIAINYNLAMRQFKKEVGSVFVSDQIRAYLLNTTMSNWSVLLRAIHLRSSLADMDILRDISSNVFYRSHIHSNTAKFEKLISEHDITKFVQEYPIGHQLPSSNIKSWRSDISIERQATKIRRRLIEESEFYSPGPIALHLVVNKKFAQLYPHLIPHLIEN